MKNPSLPRPFNADDLKHACRSRKQFGVLLMSPERDQWTSMAREAHYADTREELVPLAVAYRDRVMEMWDGEGAQPWVRVACRDPRGDHIQILPISHSAEDVQSGEEG